MRKSLRALLALMAVFVLAFSVAACGDDEDSGGSGGGSGGGEDTAAQEGGGAPGQLIEADPANKGKNITIGSKNFPEQYILGEIYAQALEAAGFTVKKSLDLGPEQVAFKALKGGDVDAYPEYSGTALTAFYKLKTDDVPRDPQEAYDLLKEKAAADDITAMPQTQFQNTFRVTSSKATADELGNPKTLTEVAEKAKGKSISGFPECRSRTDCLVGLQDVYKWDVKFVSSQGQYTDIDKKQSDFTFGFSTDGALTLTDKYVTYEDDKQLFPPYYVSLLTRTDAADRIGPAGLKVIEDIQKPLTEEVMRELNSRVSIDKQEPEAVAAQYLKESGFTK